MKMLSFGICVILTVMVRSLTFAVDPPAAIDAELQGVWFGTSFSYRTVMIIDGNRMICINPLGECESSITIKKTEPINEIDISRFDGKQQLGVYSIEIGNLTLALTDPGIPKRPTGKTAKDAGRNPNTRAIFTRRPTLEGLEAIRTYLESVKDVRTAVNVATVTGFVVGDDKPKP
jgi:hypothetical protein